MGTSGGEPGNRLMDVVAAEGRELEAAFGRIENDTTEPAERRRLTDEILQRLEGLATARREVLYPRVATDVPDGGSLVDLATLRRDHVHQAVPRFPTGRPHTSLLHRSIDPPVTAVVARPSNAAGRASTVFPSNGTGRPRFGPTAGRHVTLATPSGGRPARAAPPVPPDRGPCRCRPPDRPSGPATGSGLRS